MSGSLAGKTDVFAQIAETKRIYLAVESLLSRGKPTTVVVTSSMPGEGKTTVAAALAGIAAHQGGFRVLAADLNWYAPSLHEYFGLDLSLELDRLKGTEDITKLAQSPGMNGLDVLPAVRETREGFGSDGEPSALGARIVEQAREAYDLVIVDTPSISRTNRHMMDPVSLSKVADGTVLVVLANVTSRERVKHAHVLLETSGASVLGVVVNQWKNRLA